MKTGRFCFVYLCAASVFSLLFTSCDSGIPANRLEPQTIYADGFDEGKFASIVIGDGKDRVLKLMGDPLRTFEIGGLRYMSYSDMGSYTSIWQKAYHQRWIALDEQGNVKHVLSRLITAEDNPVYPFNKWEMSTNGVYRLSR